MRTSQLDQHEPADSVDRLRSAIDATIPVGLDIASPARAIRSGRRTIRRRRAAGAAGALAVAVLAGVGVGAVSGSTPVGPSVDTGAGPATTPPAAGADTGSTPAPSTNHVPIVDPDASSVGISGDGRLVVPPGVQVRTVVEDWAGLTAPAHSVAAEVVDRDLPPRYQLQRVYLTLQPDLAGPNPPLGVEEDGSGGGGAPASASPHLDLATLARVIDRYNDPHAWPYTGLAEVPFLDLDGRLVLPDGATLLDRSENPLGLEGSQRSLAVAWVDPSDPVSRTEQWAVLVSDVAWRPGDSSAFGLLNGFARDRQDPEPGTTFGDWAASRTIDDFVADPPPAWAGEVTDRPAWLGGPS